MCKSPSWGTAGERRFDCSQRGAVHQLTDQKVSIRVVETLVSHGAVACVDMHRDTIACLWVSCPTNSCQTLQRSVEGYTAPLHHISNTVSIPSHPIPLHGVVRDTQGLAILRKQDSETGTEHTFTSTKSVFFSGRSKGPQRSCATQVNEIN